MARHHRGGCSGELALEVLFEAHGQTGVYGGGRGEVSGGVQCVPVSVNSLVKLLLSVSSLRRGCTNGLHEEFVKAFGLSVGLRP